MHPSTIGAALAASLLLLGCASDVRLSTDGETCARTGDCVEPLRCVDAICVPPGEAAKMIRRRGPDGRPPNTAARVAPAPNLPVPDGAGPAAGAGRGSTAPPAPPVVNPKPTPTAAGPASAESGAAGFGAPPAGEPAGALPNPGQPSEPGAGAPPAGPGGR